MDIGVYAMASAVLDELTAQLNDTRAGQACIATVYPGVMAVDEFGCGCNEGEGQAWVRVANMYPTVNFPDQYVLPFAGYDPLTWAVVLELGVTRCYPITKNGDMPPAAHLDSAARDAMDDAAAMRRAAMCAFGNQVPRILGSWEPRGPNAGVHGGTMLMTFLADVNCGCDVIPPQLDEMIPPRPGDPRIG